MKVCVICGDPVDKRGDYCDRCFQTAIEELDRKYGKQEGPSDPAKESREAR